MSLVFRDSCRSGVKELRILVVGFRLGFILAIVLRRSIALRTVSDGYFPHTRGSKEPQL